ncbi:hypothetical protein Vadar_001457 [Vaccinium darrowii]|uniref:Uncharacterized protein n=1 Tax=Vaccinium darrowii TaxID=229202 RepID=A0ACB7XMI5_9ERIC|nr:hypothetical protein Vadar_001457 [Vaccinium darrowii]
MLSAFPCCNKKTHEAILSYIKRKSCFGPPPPPPEQRRAIQRQNAAAAAPAVASATTTISEFPYDIISDILSKLPNTKSFIRCGRECKTWHYLILEPYFAKLHLSRVFPPVIQHPSNGATNAIRKLRSKIHIPNKQPESEFWFEGN